MRCRVLLASMLSAALIASAAPAAAAPTTQVIQGNILRLVSTADWEVASSLRPGDQAQWDVEVSADAPDPGTVTVGVSATGDALIYVDAQLCMQGWVGSACPSGAVALRSDWEIPRDGVQVDLTSFADTEVAHVRLTITLGPGVEVGTTSMLLHAKGDSETAVVGPGGGVGSLPATGLSPIAAWIFWGGAALIVIGLLLAGARRRRDDAGGES